MDEVDKYRNQIINFVVNGIKKVHVEKQTIEGNGFHNTSEGEGYLAALIDVLFEIKKYNVMTKEAIARDFSRLLIDELITKEASNEKI